jgi:hypothetical protein
MKLTLKVDEFQIYFYPFSKDFQQQNIALLELSLHFLKNCEDHY